MKTKLENSHSWAAECWWDLRLTTKASGKHLNWGSKHDISLPQAYVSSSTWLLFLYFSFHVFMNAFKHDNNNIKNGFFYQFRSQWMSDSGSRLWSRALQDCLSFPRQASVAEVEGECGERFWEEFVLRERRSVIKLLDKKRRLMKPEAGYASKNEDESRTGSSSSGLLGRRIGLGCREYLDLGEACFAILGRLWQNTSVSHHTRMDCFRASFKRRFCIFFKAKLFSLST